MSQPTTQAGQFRFDPRAFREVPAGQFWGRVLAMLLGVALAGGLVAYWYTHRVVGADVALGQQTRKTEGYLDGVRANSFEMVDALKYYTPAAWPPRAGEVLWLGNSQIYAINQPRAGDEVAPVLLARELGRPVFGLHLPSASFQDYLIMQEWAFTQRRPDWVVMVAVFDDLREDVVRAELALAATPEVLGRLRTASTGARLAGDLERLSKRQNKDLQGTTRSTRGRYEWWPLAFSPQEWSEDHLERALSNLWPVWAARTEMRAAILIRLYQLRDWAFGINTRTIRPQLEGPYRHNMASLGEALERNRDRGVRTLVYVAPLRRDFPAPYEPRRYADWKRELASFVSARGGTFADLEDAVPDDLWGTVNGRDIDFMHYQGAGHRLVAQRLARIIADAPPAAPAPPSPAGTTQGGGR